jgi:alpha,alpha-trehalase
LSAATLYPLFFGVATPEQARAVAAAVRDRLLQPDGLATTTARTGEQWDAPNGWAPLQWIAIEGLNIHGHSALAREIAVRWMRENVAVYRATGRLVEKYDVSGDAAARGGEYPLQDGFGWTNGVLRRLLALYPSAIEIDDDRMLSSRESRLPAHRRYTRPWRAGTSGSPDP